MKHYQSDSQHHQFSLIKTCFLQTKKDTSYVEVKDLANGEDYGIVVSKKNPEVLKKLNDGLKKIRENGTFAKIHEKWFLVKE